MLPASIRQPARGGRGGARPDRREAVLRAAKGAGAFVIEDRWARDFALEGEPSPTLASGDPDGHVVYVRSLTKILATGMRIAALCAKGPAGERLKAARRVKRPLRGRPVAGAGFRRPVLAGVGEAPSPFAQGASGPTRRARTRRPRAPARGGEPGRAPRAACIFGRGCPKGPTTLSWRPRPGGRGGGEPGEAGPCSNIFP